MFDAKARRGYTLHTPSGFLVFNEGKVTTHIPDEYRAVLEANEVIGGGDAAAEHDDREVPSGAFTLTHTSFGNYEITGPGLDEPERVKGKANAEARLAELEAAAKADSEAPAD